MKQNVKLGIMQLRVRRKNRLSNRFIKREQAMAAENHLLAASSILMEPSVSFTARGFSKKSARDEHGLHNVDRDPHKKYLNSLIAPLKHQLYMQSQSNEIETSMTPTTATFAQKTGQCVPSASIDGKSSPSLF